MTNLLFITSDLDKSVVTLHFRSRRVGQVRCVIKSNTKAIINTPLVFSSITCKTMFSPFSTQWGEYVLLQWMRLPHALIPRNSPDSLHSHILQISISQHPYAVLKCSTSIFISGSTNCARVLPSCHKQDFKHDKIKTLDIFILWVRNVKRLYLTLDRKQWRWFLRNKQQVLSLHLAGFFCPVEGFICTIAIPVFTALL